MVKAGGMTKMKPAMPPVMAKKQPKAMLNPMMAAKIRTKANKAMGK